jgi:peptidoglycan/xylan/chitin deacetylase (PgdA/CDA1 family)
VEIIMSTVVLMYHGIYNDDADLKNRISLEDRPYAVSRDVFERHLQLIEQCPEGCEIIITFDDGHLSNYDIALPLLLKAKRIAYFFITTDFMQNRDFFCRPKQLSEMLENGMSIGSHGVTHRFLDSDLTPDELTQELQGSRTTLEAALGFAVNSISFPGGRYSSKALSIARACGYEQLFASVAGVNRQIDFEQTQPIKRVAIRKNTGDDEFARMIAGDSSYYAKIALKHNLKTGLRKLLGNRLYHGLYKSVAG